MDGISKKELNFFNNILPKEDIVFYPMRVDDPRYDFKCILDYVEESNKLMVITNPTNIEIEYNHHIIDLSDSVNKRGLYFKILSKLKSSDRIIHACDDVHISLFEQLSLSEADVTFNDTMHILDIDTYIKS
ncbi:hypothetical protein HYO65_gp164 [Tenacibaculum phage PTm1]|uniref:Uncharacterized protein n=2 Tax=Shirahamavirus PTm1 TaxID=2846435 RepID=A0A5S9HX95_9CAUD|nr:hypothetical protein HYO65_gp164 [Tenacibaculum phage PTm1]BBI90556.1 hypothetical protein [Tenacibaculum phage PTm1]BBI90864.1 hypothetical protein [Tenacibaculum phage PTm5]